MNIRIPYQSFQVSFTSPLPFIPKVFLYVNYSIKRNTYEIANIRPTGQQEKEIMTKDIVPMSFNVPNAIHFQIGDYVDVWGERYELYELAEPTKNHTQNFDYSLTFKAQWYKLSKWKFRGYDGENQLKVIEWQFTGTLLDFLTMIVVNANRNLAGWTIGDCDESEMQTLSFSGENILQAMSQICEAFKTEWSVTNQVIHFAKRGEVTGYKFEYGYDKGLKGGLRRTNVDSSNVFSRLFVQGSTQNLPADYRFGQKRLQLPAGMDFIQSTKYGPDEIEADVVFDDIRPERIGTISAIDGIFKFSDSGLDFDINEQLLPGLSAKISFLSGSLTGYNFEIQKGGYNPTTKQITIVKSDLEKESLPNDTLHPQVGDTYYIFDIEMPDSYVTDASNRLLTAGAEYVTKNAPPKTAYEVLPDHFYFERNSTVLRLGDFYGVKDLDLLLNKDIRMIGYVRDLHEEFKYLSMQLSDVVNSAEIVRQYNETAKVKKALNLNKIMNVQRSRENWKTTMQLTTLLDTLKAEMLLITVDGGAYQTNITSTTTLTDFIATDGHVFHEQYTEHKGIWDVTGLTASLVDDIPYYIYIRASRAANSAQVIKSPTKIAVESDPLLYYFPFGVISSIIDGDRFFTSLRGYTRVTGGQIATGEIVANNGVSNINLDKGTFNFQNILAQIAFTEEGVVLNGKIIATSAEFIDLIVQNLRTKATGKRVQILESENNIEIYNALEQVLIQLDDDSAIEGTYQTYDAPVLNPDGSYPKDYLWKKPTGTPGEFRYTYAILGPGVSVGVSPTDANGYSTFGRKEISTNGVFKAGFDDAEQTTISKDGITTTGDFTVAGNVEIGGDITLDGDPVFTGDIEYLNGVGTNAFLRVKNGLITSPT